jgi:hypothetical protein
LAFAVGAALADSGRPKAGSRFQQKRPTAMVGRSGKLRQSLRCLSADRAADLGTGVLVHGQIVRFPAVLFDFRKNLIFTVPTDLPVTSLRAHVGTAEVKLLVSLTCAAFRRWAFRKILCHVDFPPAIIFSLSGNMME